MMTKQLNQRRFLVALIDAGVIELHTWNARVDDVERPDRIVFDIDPGEGVAWRDIVAAARRLRAILEQRHLASWVKTTGGKGLHVVVPLVPDADWDECFAFARAFAAALVKRDPTRWIYVVSKEKRRGKILIDYLRNNRTNTSIAAYSTRAKPDAP